MLDPREPPLGRRALDGVCQPGGGTLRCLFLKLFGPKWRRESNQMTFIKKSFTFPSPFENSFRVSSHCPVTPHFQMCDQKWDSAQFQLRVPLELTSLVFQFCFLFLSPKIQQRPSVGAVLTKPQSLAAGAGRPFYCLLDAFAHSPGAFAVSTEDPEQRLALSVPCQQEGQASGGEAVSWLRGQRPCCLLL